MSVPNVDVSAWVPPSMLSDLRRVITTRREKKDTDIIIFIPIEDFGPMMLDIQNQMQTRGMGYMPFTPVVLEAPVAAHDKEFLAVQSRPYGNHTAPIMFDVTKGEHEVTNGY